MALIENQELYKKLENTINKNIEIHAIYEPDESEAPYQSFYLAAVELFQPGMTFRVYFTITKSGKINVHDVQRWYFG